jgi:hypothetical protein
MFKTSLSSKISIVVPVAEFVDLICMHLELFDNSEIKLQRNNFRHHRCPDILQYFVISISDAASAQNLKALNYTKKYI